MFSVAVAMLAASEHHGRPIGARVGWVVVVAAGEITCARGAMDSPLVSSMSFGPKVEEKHVSIIRKKRKKERTNSPPQLG